MKKTMIVALSLIVMANFANLHAKDNSEELDIKMEKAIVFKDGYCLIVKHAVGTTNEKGMLYTNEVPNAAVLGSFWAVPKKEKFISMTADIIKIKETEKTEALCQNTLELLLANKGKECELEMNDKSVHKGTIKEVLTTINKTPDRNPSISINPSSSFLPVSSRLMVNSVSGMIFILETQTADLALRVDSVKTVSVNEMKYKRIKEVEKQKKVKRLTFAFNEKNAKKEMMIMYFTPGVRWIPTYRIKLSGEEVKDKLATISLQAEILNELEDFNDVLVDLVVGVPNFRFKNTISPFSLEGVLKNALNQATPQIMGQYGNQFSNALFTQRRSEHRRSRSNPSPRENRNVSVPEELASGAIQDLYVYHLEKINLKKGARAAVPIFTSKVPYKDIYTWNLTFSNKNASSASAASGLASPLKLSKNRVWHQVELQNNTEFPWTTGAVMFMEGNQPLCQELLTYTSAKTSVRVPITVATDLRGDFSDSEIKRTPKALRYDRYDYMKIDRKGVLSLVNNKSIPVNIEIICEFGGRATKASENGKITLDSFHGTDWEHYRGARAVNNHSNVKWDATIKPGETFKPEIDYFYYIRH